MASKILDSAKQFLAENNTIKLAHLVKIELPGDTASYLYYTDYGRGITYDGNLFVSGRLKSVGDIKQSNTLTSYTIPIKVTGVAQAELDQAVESASHIDKKISIWRVYLDADGNHVPFYADGATLLLFSGTVTELGVEENVSPTSRGTSTITWKCSNEFYDLERVNGRLTDDASHRGLVVDAAGNEIPSTAAKRIEYQNDLGFFHANKSINILAQYQTQEKRYKTKEKKNFFGIVTGVSTTEYYETVTKEVDMRFDLGANYIPCIYGTQKVDGIPVFADTLVDNPNKVYVVYAFAEGEIDGFLDIWMDEKPLVCADTTDIEDRACFGVKRDVGDTISVATPAQSPSAPSVHGQEYVVNDGNAVSRFWTFHGKSDQTAAQVLVDLAADGKFYLQNRGDITGPEYWDSRYQLLDTAYVVAVYDINGNRTNIPTLSAEIQGKKIPVYDRNGLVSTDKTSLNTAWQSLDYLKSTLYGAGVTDDRINLSSFVEVAEIFDVLDTSYDAAWVPFWRYVGWETPYDPNSRQVMQTNVLFNTNDTVFKNMETLLQQVVCSLNVVEGKYTLSVEAKKDSVADFTIGDFSGGKLALSDLSTKEKFNAVLAAIGDPGRGWEKNEIVFYNAEYKAEDNNVEKKSNLQFPFITNYYTARSMAGRELNKSRFNRELALTVSYKWIDLPINANVTVTYERFKWDKKKFLVTDVVARRDGKVQLKLREYIDGIFINEPQSDKGDSQLPVIGNNVKPPRDVNYLPATSADSTGVNGYLRWLPSYTPDVTYYALRISGKSETITFPVTDLVPDPNTFLSYALTGLAKGSYTMEVRAVAGLTGLVSSPTILVVDIDPAVNLPRVENFDLTNNIPGNEQVWSGGDIMVSWDRLVEYEAIVPGLRYTLEFLDNGILTHGYSITNAGAFTHTRATNKADYASNNLGAVGVYRNLDVRIRAFGPDGEQSVDWTYL